ncbi:anti-CBASS protein Acb1 family protein [Sphingomonas montanisoli]|uniref:Anti-CBASS protein Acb1 n=1 Tax=Sphingomonas montanisoli TaxID=2606412 RepID=A0A5D9C6F9_9SPHN|nr:anti-CBASS Acb1 family protein [Sphingomonas montanisoli]TZG25591.1 DUF1073 domain-containing protein [Sphingomonas montanisoli]
MNTPFADGIVNALTGAGTGRDPRSYNAYLFRRLSDVEIEATYRASWLCRKGIDKPATEMVRERRNWQADADQIKKLEALERKLDLWNKLKRAETLRGLGGAAMVMWIGNDRPDAPINPDIPGKLRSLHVWHKSRLTLGPMRTDPADEWYGYPTFYTLNTGGRLPVNIHPSRVIAFRGDPIPDIRGGSWEEQFWGDSKVQTVLDAVQNSDTAQNGFAALIKDARNRRVGIPNFTQIASSKDGEAMMAGRMKAMALGESMFGVTFYDSGDGTKGGETIEDRQMTWAGIPDINNNYLAMVCGAFDMPATVMLGKSPDGQNSTGASDIELWHKTIKARQDLDLRPCIDQLDVVLVPTALGAPDDEVWWEFAPLSTPSEKEEAETFKATADAMDKVRTSGAIPDEAFAKGYQNLLSEKGWIPGLDGALAEIPEDERFGLNASNDDDANEEDPSALQAGQRLAANDALPRTLYVSRKVVNVAEIKAWAKDQGLPELQDDLHVTIAFSRTPVDWIKMGGGWMGEDGKIVISPGGPRVVEPLGDRTAVLLFASTDLSWRNMSIREAGASWDHPDYQPHISLTGEPVDVSTIEPYRGKIVLGPEVFEEIREGGL